MICAKCNKEINSQNELIKVSNKSYHAECLVCESCNQPVNSKKFTLDSLKRVICDKCKSQNIRCSKCSKSIDFGTSYKKLGNNQCYHNQCFTCSECSTPISGEFYERNNAFICLKCNEIEVMKFIKICKVCNSKVTSRYVMYNKEFLHSECFQCSQCMKQLSDGVFYEHDKKEPVCEDCHQEFLKENQKNCVKCKNVISESGIKFLLDYYHVDCFGCSKCLKNLSESIVLANGKNKPFCENCYLAIYGKKCDKCNSLINPKESSASFEGKHYHKECLNCFLCGKSIVDLAFYKKDSHLLCEQCK